MSDLPESREDKLARMKAAAARKAAAEAEYKTLKDELLPELEGEDRVYFIDPDGEKRYATVSTPDMTQVDLEWARENLTPEMYAAITKPDAPDLKTIEYLAQRGKISAEQLSQLVSYEPGTKRINFSDPIL